jgi:tetratricopeptide (TPR) repeat protein/transglutaminase-like putative cysteine protease
MMRWLTTVAVCALGAGAANAEQTPLYQPVPVWVKPAPPITASKALASAPIMLLLDTQQRLKDGQVWRYVDAATRVASAEVLAQAGMISVPWQPANGDLIIHRIEIIRGDQHIDLLASGKRFTVLRREEKLEQLELNGQLTATMPVEGLRIGDVVHTTMSVTNRDAALNGNVQASIGLPAAPFRVGYARTRFLWPVADPVHWKAYAEGPKPVLTTDGGERELVFEGTLPKQPEVPPDMPSRFQRPPFIEVSSFADWAAVSATMAPLYATKGLIEKGSPLEAEVSRIKASESDPLRRTARALALVQDEVRYLYNGMEGGNYRPQTPAETWSLRYGDCKAKSLLLLAVLHALNIEAEAVLAPAQAGDLLQDRLPSPGAFDHVIVRASVAGETLWLDGTVNGTRLEDIRDVPAFRTTLPLRTSGAQPLAVPFRAPTRPAGEVTIDFDQRAGLTMPTLATVTMTMRGQMGAAIGMAATQATPEQKREMAQGMVKQLVGEMRLTDQTLAFDQDSGVGTLTATGLLSTTWKQERGRRRMPLDRAIGDITFEPDRTRPAWRTIPVALGAPDRSAYHVRVRLPRGGKGFELAGDQTLAEVIAGRTLNRRISMKGDLIALDDEIATAEAEVAADAIAATRARVALAQGRRLEIIAPADTLSHAAEAAEAKRSGSLKPLLAAYDKAVANDPEDKDVYLNRARFLVGTYNYAAAIPDVTKAIEIEPSADTYLWRASLHEIAGDLKRQLADLEEATKLDPSSSGALGRLATYRLDHGEKAAAVAMVTERIEAGGRNAADYLQVKADLLARGGDTNGAIAAIDQAIVANPGNAMLLNSRCWIKGTLNVQLDSALKDCTRALELSSERVATLDSRALVYFRLNRFDEALADLSAALEESPDLAASLYLRGVIAARQRRSAESQNDLSLARTIAPLIDREYARWGIKP